MQPVFIAQDSSWRTSILEWGPDFNARLANVLDSEPPALTIPQGRPDVSEYRVSNENALKLLDSRQASKDGGLPVHICALAFQNWSGAERRVLARLERLGLESDGLSEALFEENYVYSIAVLLKFNLASLSLVDSTTPSFMLAMVPNQFRECLSALQAAEDMEPELERMLGVPSPTRQLRYSIESVL